MQKQAVLREVLIVEDEPPITSVLASIVEECGYIALLATNGKQALAMLQHHHPSLILTDLMMPLMNGAELITALRALETQLPPIVIMSAAGRHNVIGAGADAIMDKPFDVEEVEALLHHFLRER